MEAEMINQFVNQLAMCELLSAHSLIQPSLSFECKQIEIFIQESYFDNNYKLNKIDDDEPVFFILFTVNSPSRNATTIQLLVISKDRSTTRRSPLIIPAFFILSPTTLT